MQTDNNALFSLTAERTGKEENLYKAIGNLVFSTLYKKQRRPNFLITKLKGVGSWYLRKKRIEDIILAYPPNFKEFPEETKDFGEKMKKLRYENKVEIYNLLKERINDYKEYIAERDVIRKKRYETQTILQSKEDS